MEIDEAAIRLLVATLLGGIIGIEREYRNKSAGFRTMIMISLGSALFTILSLSIFEDYRTTDPTRIISYIIGGIGFLGAGAILKDGLNIRGLTTASTIWLVAALGIGSGMGYFTITIFATVVALLSLVVLPFLEIIIGHQSEYRHYTISTKDLKTIDTINSYFKKHNLHIIRIWRSKSADGPIVKIIAHGKPTNHEHVAEKMINNTGVISF